MDEASIYVIWKARISFLIDEYDLKVYINKMVVVPTDPDQLKEYKKEMANAKRLILDEIRDHVVSHIAALGTTKEMWYSLSTLYQGSSEQWKMYLEEKLRCTRMQKGERIDPFLTRIQEIRDEIAAVGAMPQPTELVPS